MWVPCSDIYPIAVSSPKNIPHWIPICKHFMSHVSLEVGGILHISPAKRPRQRMTTCGPKIKRQVMEKRS